MFMFANLLNQSVCKAQITLDTTVYPADLIYFFNPVQISSTETKYYVGDTVTNTFNLYNMDFTPFLMNVVVPEPFIKLGAVPSIFRAIYITRALFDCDTSNIEYAYESASTGWETFYIMRTDGTELFRLDSANGPYCFGDCLGGADWVKPIVNTSSGTKLFLQRFWGGVNIYSLCGTLPRVFDFTNDNMNQIFMSIFPNPTSGSLTFEINSPSNMEEFELVIVDNNGRDMRRQKVNFRNHQYTIDVSDFDNGTYIYSLCSKNKSYQNGKFLINK